MKKLLALVFLLAFYSCENNVAKNDQESMEVQSALRILQESGIPTSDYTVVGGYIHIEDVKFEIADVNKIDTRNKQYFTNFLASQTNAADVKIKFTNNVPQVWKDATLFGMARWSEISSSKLNIREVSSGQDITVDYSNMGSNGPIASASFPTSDGRVGPTIDINSYFDYLQTTYKNFTMTHEMGHCFGFRHTNWFDRNSDGNATTNDNEGVSTIGANHVPGTPTGLDPNSVMNAIVQTWEGFSQYDMVAAGYMYPADGSGDPVDPDPVDPVDPSVPTGEIEGPDVVSRRKTGTFTAPEGNSYQWYYNIGNGWTAYETSRSISFRYRGYIDLAVVVNGEYVFYKYDIRFR